MARPSKRVIPAAIVAAALALGLAAGPVGATTIGHEHYSNDYGFSFDDCGFWVDVAGHDEGVTHLRVGKGKFDSAFFFSDNFAFEETWTNRDTGTWITISGNALFHETKATPLGGTLFAFRSIQSGVPFMVTDQDGNLIVRDRGVLREEIVFDTLGDDTPGGEFITQNWFVVNGPHEGLDFDICAALG